MVVVVAMVVVIAVVVVITHLSHIVLSKQH